MQAITALAALETEGGMAAQVAPSAHYLKRLTGAAAAAAVQAVIPAMAAMAAMETVSTAQPLEIPEDQVLAAEAEAAEAAALFLTGMGTKVCMAGQAEELVFMGRVQMAMVYMAVPNLADLEVAGAVPLLEVVEAAADVEAVRGQAVVVRCASYGPVHTVNSHQHARQTNKE